ncbi:hypothetical protein [Enterobacter ludwigii]|uniref:hypothetical protein n=1 Tax=Enterobacter ludwigii TaxID=299767 RepID=UPI0022E777AE|nr:hypothetical protein [Enterobacter ludwigii]
MDESRKAFEEWAIKSGHSISLDARGRYVFSYTATAWAGWQASRAAIEIALPDIEVITGNYTAPGDGWEVYDAQETDKAIRAAGIKVKE